MLSGEAGGRNHALVTKPQKQSHNQLWGFCNSYPIRSIFLAHRTASCWLLHQNTHTTELTHRPEDSNASVLKCNAKRYYKH